MLPKSREHGRLNEPSKNGSTDPIGLSLLSLVTHPLPPGGAYVSLHLVTSTRSQLGSPRLRSLVASLTPNLSLPENSQSHGCHHMATIPGPDSNDNLPKPVSHSSPPPSSFYSSSSSSSSSSFSYLSSLFSSASSFSTIQ